jgi:threonine dehydrogenase-like Zn-dependent dehydrogenase
LGASKVMIADINSERLQLAKEMGADVLINCKEVNLQEEGQAHHMFSRFLNL